MADKIEIKEGRTSKRKFDRSDFPMIAEALADELQRRKSDRKEKEKQWDDIDRQVSMKPDTRFKKTRNGKDIPEKLWMPELALSDQVQTHEVTVADARRMMLPGGKSWFSAHAVTTDEYLDRVDFQSLIPGDEAEVPNRVNQENADKLVEGWLNSFHRMYDFGGELDKFNGEAAKYGTGIARAIPIKIDKDQGRKTQRIVPRFVPQSVRNTYLDDRPFRALGEGIDLSPTHQRCWKALLADLVVAANKGSNDPNKLDGGWMPAQLKGIEGDKDGHVEIVESEGDIVVPRKTVSSFVLRNVIITQVMSKGDPRIVRLRFSSLPFNSYIIQPFHVVDPSDPYGVGPLMIGRPIDIAGETALNKLMAWAALNIEPPIKYDRDDMAFEAEGGPVLEPRRLWRTLGKVEPQKIGEGEPLLKVFAFLQAKYADSTATQASRLGAQTVSHTTAFAKEMELLRGTLRTVDYANGALQGSLTRWLYMEYEMGRRVFSGKQTVFVDAYGTFASIEKDHLPDDVIFEVFGAAGPAEERTKMATKLQAVQQAMQVEILRQQAGFGPGLDLNEIQRTILREGGWVDVDPFFASSGISQGSEGAGGVGGVNGSGPGAAIAQLASFQGS